MSKYLILIINVFLLAIKEVPLLTSLITSKTRVRLLLRFFLNPGSTAYLRGLAEEFGESTNGIRVELNRLADADLLLAENEGRKISYQANQKHPLFGDIHSLVKKFIGIDKLIDEIFSRMGEVELAFITGDYAKGIDSGIIDLIVVGDLNKEYFFALVEKTESLINRKVRTLFFLNHEFQDSRENLEIDKALIVWGTDQR